MRTCTGLQIRVYGALESHGLQSRHSVEAQVDGSGVWAGESSFDFLAADPSRMTAQDYGKALGSQLINTAIERALVYAGAFTGAPVSVRLFLDGTAEAMHTTRWERAFIPIGGTPWPVAISPTVTFSRYIPVEMADVPPLDTPSFQVLLAVSNPSNLPPESLIDVEAELGALVDEFKKKGMPSRLAVTVLPGRTGISANLAALMKEVGWKVESGPSSLQNIGDIAARISCHGLHILSHGDFKAGMGQGILYLETAGGLMDRIVDDQLRVWVSPLLRLVILQACRTAAPAPADQPPFVGVAAKMLRFGVPAVIAMQDFVAVDDARVFASAFYRQLLLDGVVDTAVNAGRKAIDSRGGDWSIPALFQRLTTGKLWSSDPVREAVLANRFRISDPPGYPETLPLKVVQQANGIKYDPLADPVGPLFDLDGLLCTLPQKERAICLTGPAGSNKTGQLQKLFCQLADAFLDDSFQPAPVWLAISDLAIRSGGRRDATSSGVARFDQAIASIIDGNESIPPFLLNRRFIFLVASDQDLGPRETQLALRALRILVDRLASSCVFIFDESNLDALQPSFPKAIVLVTRPLELTAVRAFLTSTNRPADLKLRRMIDDRGLGDLASTPWLLSQMRELARYDNPMDCQAAVMNLIADNFLSEFSIRAIPRSSAIQALKSVAWFMQFNRRQTIPNADLWKILDEARGGRDIRLSEFQDALVACNLLSPVGDEESRLSYTAICAYFAARYLLDSADSHSLLGDITASLGRLSRLRHWDDTLIMFAGLQPTAQDRERVLQVLLAGSSLVEGEQVFLAARLFIEMRQSAGNLDLKAFLDAPVVRQMVDTLIWRSRPDIARPYRDRRLAVQHLAAMRHPKAIPHLMALAFDRSPMAAEAPKDPSVKIGPPVIRFDFSGIRMLAVEGLFDQPLDTKNYVEASRPELRPVLAAWEELVVRGNTGPVIDILLQNDPSTSVVAAFAFALEKDKFAGDDPLLSVFRDPATNREIRWGITEVLGRMDATLLTEEVILPGLAKDWKPNPFLCYLIQQSTLAPPDSPQRKYLESCLSDPEVSTRAIRALARVPDPEVRDSLRSLCHQLLRCEWTAANHARGVPIPTDSEGILAWHLQHSALESLRDVGNLESVELLRDVRTRLINVLVQLSFEVGEEIYWRCTGGLAKENY